MPNIEKSYQIENIALNNIYNDSLGILNNLGAQNIRDNSTNQTIKEFTGTIPSIWGWGGMNISVRIEQTSENVVKLTLNGYIAQMGTSPLTKQMDNFLQQLQSILKEKYGYSFEYEKLTRFLPKYKMSINYKDKKVFIAVIIFAFLSTLLSEFFEPGVSLLLTGIMILFGYKFGKKLYK